MSTQPTKPATTTWPTGPVAKIEDVFKTPNQVAQHKKGLKCLIWGKEDTYKSGFALSWPQPIYDIDTELGSPPLFKYFIYCPTCKQYTPHVELPDGFGPCIICKDPNGKMKDIQWCDATLSVYQLRLRECLNTRSDIFIARHQNGRSSSSMVSRHNRRRRIYYGMQIQCRLYSCANSNCTEITRTLGESQLACTRTNGSYTRRQILAIRDNKSATIDRYLPQYNATTRAKEKTSHKSDKVLRIAINTLATRFKRISKIHHSRAYTTKRNLSFEQWKSSRVVIEKTRRDRRGYLNPNTDEPDPFVALQRLESTIGLLKDIGKDLKPDDPVPGTIVIDSGTDVILSL